MTHQTEDRHEMSLPERLRFEATHINAQHVEVSGTMLFDAADLIESQAAEIEKLKQQTS